VVGKQFVCSEELSQPTYFGGQLGNQIQQYAYTHHFSFRQGYDLAAFGTIEEKLREAMTTLIYGHPTQQHPVPMDLDEWAKHVRFAVQVYGTYFKAFYPPFEQYVGSRLGRVAYAGCVVSNESIAFTSPAEPPESHGRERLIVRGVGGRARTRGRAGRSANSSTISSDHALITAFAISRRQSAGASTACHE
jgi:hypothetical protein